MMVAQQLYEGIALKQGTVGLITYMRTNSTRIADSAKAEAAEFIEKTYGDEFSAHGGKAKIRKVHKMPMKRFVRQAFKNT